MRRLLWGCAAVVVCLLASGSASAAAQGTSCDSPCKLIPLPLVGPRGAVCDSPCKLILLPLISQRAQASQVSAPFIVGTVDTLRGIAKVPRKGPPSATHAYFEYQVDKRTMLAPGSPLPVLPDSLRREFADGEVVTAFVVDTMGRVDVASLAVIRSPSPLFAAAVRDALPKLRFIPAEIAGVKVKEFVQAFTFTLPR